MVTVDKSENTTVALDLATLKTMSLGGDMKKVTQRSFVFLDSNRILGMASNKLEDSGVFSFPDGKRQSKFSFGGEELDLAGDPNFVVIKPLSNAKLGVFDVSRNEIISAMNKIDATVWKNNLVYEGGSGELILASYHFDQEKKRIELDDRKTIAIPAAAIGSLSVSEVADNFQWLAISSKTRGGLWSLNSGERKVFVRGFTGAVVSNNGTSIGEFPKLDTVNHSLVFLNPADAPLTLSVKCQRLAPGSTDDLSCCANR
jgi:hypothetical protein